MPKESQRKKKFRASAWYKQRGICAGPCGMWLPLDAATFDHIMPRAAGGKTTKTNCQMMCQPCNERKAASIPTVNKRKAMVS